MSPAPIGLSSLFSLVRGYIGRMKVLRNPIVALAVLGLYILSQGFASDQGLYSQVMVALIVLLGTAVVLGFKHRHEEWAIDKAIAELTENRKGLAKFIVSTIGFFIVAGLIVGFAGSDPDPLASSDKPANAR